MNDQIRVSAPASRPEGDAPAEYFTGRVRLTPLFSAEAPARAAAASVAFSAGARTHWHTHPYRQTLIVTESEGWVQAEGGPRQSIHVGDVVSIPPDIKHWHGATATSPMTHTAVQEAKEGSPVTWLEPVADSDYNLE